MTTIHKVATDDYDPKGEGTMTSDSEHESMRVTSIRLPDDLAAALDREADLQGVSMSELVREGVLLRLALALAERAQSGDLRGVLEALRSRR